MKSNLKKGSRSKILAFFVIVMMLVFAMRLFYLQIIKHSYYVEVANSEQIKRLTIPAERGKIYALDGDDPIPLVMNQAVYTVFADPKTVSDPDKVVEVMKEVAGGNLVTSDIKSLLNDTDSRYQILAKKLTRVQANKIKAEGLDGIGFQEETQRVYPEGTLAAQTLGFVDYNGDGKYGVEGGLDDELKGTDGMLQSVTDVSDVPLSIGDDYVNTPAVDGENIVLTIDRNVQSEVESALKSGLERLGATRGSAVVVNPQNGQIMAMANLPSYDPSNISSVTDIAAFNNAVVSAPYEAGSDIKTLTLATGIDKGVITPTSTYNNTDYIDVDGVTISNAVYGHTGNITFQTALTWSLNTGFVTIAKLLGDGQNINKSARDTMYDYFYNKFKLGQLTGVEVANEAAGTVISPEKTEGNAVRYSNMAFGQGMDVTMVQVAAAFSSLVNGGKYYTPTVIAGTINSNGDYIKKEIATPSTTVSESTANQVKEMTHITRQSLVSNETRYYTGGKTGTSQVVKNGVYADDETIATYLGYGGSKETTKYVIMVQVSGDEMEFQGARDAMPIFTEISNWMLNYLEVKPEE